jgi:hypothetical protein
MMMSLVRPALSRKVCCWIEPLMEITGHRKRTMSALIVTLDHLWRHLADVTVEGADFAPFALDSTEYA